MARAFTLALCLVSAAGLASSRRLQSTQGGECYLVEKVSGKELLPGQNWESLQEKDNSPLLSRSNWANYVRVKTDGGVGEYNFHVSPPILLASEARTATSIAVAFSALVAEGQGSEWSVDILNKGQTDEWVPIGDLSDANNEWTMVAMTITGGDLTGYLDAENDDKILIRVRSERELQRAYIDFMQVAAGVSKPEDLQFKQFPKRRQFHKGATIAISPGGNALQEALDQAQPGDIIELGDGQYWEDPKTRIDGTAVNPITIRGAGGTANRANVVLRGTGKTGRVFQIKHDFYILEDFTINGDSRENPTGPDVGDGDWEDIFRDILIFATANREPTNRAGGYRSALDGLIIRNMHLLNAGGECVRLRDFVTFTKIYGNVISDCGVYDYRYRDSEEAGKNGEGVYIGTSSKQWGDGKNWFDEPDVCLGNVVRDNYIRTRGNEGIDVKEGAIDTLIAGNEVYMQYDPDSGGIGSRASRTTIRGNFICDADGAGVRLGGWNVDGIQYGINNKVFNNEIRDCRAYGVKVMSTPQGKICGNNIVPPDDVDADNYKFSGGDYGDDYDPRASCGQSSEPFPSPTPAPSPPTCSNGFVGVEGRGSLGVACCPLTCENDGGEPQCGGRRCSQREGGSSSCCIGTITSEGKSCAEKGGAPCYIDDDEPASDDDEEEPSSTCSNGFPGVEGSGSEGTACCPLTCLNTAGEPQCGGNMCGRREGGARSCCVNGVIKFQPDCDDTTGAPCYIDDDEPASDDDEEEPSSTCSNGFPGVEGSGSAGTACCPLTCLNTAGEPQCGGNMCGRREGGARSCCVNGVNKFQPDCDDTTSAPCKNV